jgi:hypothetical protein
MLKMYVDAIKHDIQFLNTDGYEYHECTITIRLINHKPEREIQSCCEMHRGAIEYVLSSKGVEERKKAGIKPFLET